MLRLEKTLIGFEKVNKFLIADLGVKGHGREPGAEKTLGSTSYDRRCRYKDNQNRVSGTLWD